MMPKIQLSAYVILITTLASRCYTFTGPRYSNSRSKHTFLFESLDDLRRNLESSWNVYSMGQLPNTPTSAAEEAASAIMRAQAEDNVEICFVDLYLPQYDIAQGPNMYDEVEAIEFCMILTNCLTTKSVIYVKDQLSLNKVNRSLEKKRIDRLNSSEEEDMYETEEEEIVIDEDDPNWEHDADGNDEDEDSDGSNQQSSSSIEDNVDSEFYDDFSELGLQGDTFFDPKATSDEAGSLVEKLSYDDISEQQPKQDGTKRKKRSKKVKRLFKREKSGEKMSGLATMSQNYRLASLFGDSKISEGDKMTQDVVKAVKANGLPKQDEETMIILSANSEAEMLAIRALVSKYTDKKSIIFVNCRLDPLPLELESCTTVYHLTPFIATTVADPSNIFNQNSQEEARSIRAVSIRRYPGDWEVYVDADGNGFELAQKMSASKFSNKGPPAEWIVGAIKSFLEP